jgi:ATP-dependent RNA helicase DDX49/DBP8
VLVLGRAGRSGRAISLVTQYDVELVHNIEAYTQTRLEACGEIKEDQIVKLLNPVAKATRTAKLRLMELGFDEKVAEHAARKKAVKLARRQKEKRLEKKQAAQQRSLSQSA